MAALSEVAVRGEKKGARATLSVPQQGAVLGLCGEAAQSDGMFTFLCAKRILGNEMLGFAFRWKRRNHASEGIFDNYVYSSRMRIFL